MLHTTPWCPNFKIGGMFIIKLGQNFKLIISTDRMNVEKQKHSLFLVISNWEGISLSLKYINDLVVPLLGICPMGRKISMCREKCTDI